MGLLKRMLARGLSGAESPEPWSEPPHQSSWPPGPPPTAPPELAEVPQSSLFGLEQWRHPVAISQDELWDRGFERAEQQIQAAFAANGQTIELSTTATELAVNDVRFATQPRSPELALVNSETGVTHQLDAAVWAVAVALHDAYLEPLDPDRTWQIAQVQGQTLLFLARPEELRAIARRPEIGTVLELGKLRPA